MQIFWNLFDPTQALNSSTDKISIINSEGNSLVFEIIFVFH